VRPRWFAILLALLWPLVAAANLPKNCFAFWSTNGEPTITNIFDIGQHLCQVKLVGGAATLFYDAQSFDELGRVNGINFGNGTATAYSFYSISKRLNQIVTTSHSTNVQSLIYKYSQVGNVTNIADNVTGHTGGASASMTNAVYDDLNRLTSAAWTGYGIKNYGYDKIGNVLTNGESGTGTYSYGTIRPHFVRSANGVWFTSDQNGNVVFRGGQRLEYNVNNELSLALGTNGVLTKFGYGGIGERLWKSSSTNSLQVWIGGAYEEKNGQILYHIFARDRLVCTFDSTGTNVLQYYHPDHLTSSSIQTDSTGAVIQHYEYSAFGQSRYTQSSTAFPVSRRYTRQILDEDSGLYFYNARYFDPQLARFVEADTFIPDFGDPQSWNRYTYVLNNPLRFTDPDGNAPQLTGLTFDPIAGVQTHYVMEKFGDSMRTAHRGQPDTPTLVLAHQTLTAAANASYDPHVGKLDTAALYVSGVSLVILGVTDFVPGGKAVTKPVTRAAEKSVERMAERSIAKEAGEKLFRGVPAGDTEKAILGKQGVAKPRGTALDIGTLTAHVENQPAKSGVTSWTTDREIAKRFAGSDGTIIEVNRSGVANKIVTRPPVQKYGAESEVLLKGTIQGKATVP
jgi:RHS repeat-associated protein